ncbi:hypothetical protein ATCC90586_001957 [Pythium insidiosum]|nr:hypothetical protein ATCC90586_001957 [Pythium insidiosum]
MKDIADVSTMGRRSSFFSSLPRTRPAAERSSGLVMDFGAAFQPPAAKRARLMPSAEQSPQEQFRTTATNPNNPETSPENPDRDRDRDRADEDADEGDHDEDRSFSLQRLMEASSTAATCAWRLPTDQSVEQNEAFLNEQLEQIALFSVDPRRQSTREEREDTLARCRVAFSGLLPRGDNQRAADEDVDADADAMERRIRASMDVVSWLLVLRQQALDRQSALQDALRRAERHAERTGRQLAQLQQDAAALAQQLAQQENAFHAREQALVAERRALQQDKRQLEVAVAKLQGVETAFKAQLRRKDGDYERLRKSLQDAAHRSAKDQRGMALGKVLNGPTERKQTAARRVVQSHETLMTRQLIENLERKRDELLLENEALTSSFEALQRQVESVSTQYKKAVQLFLAQQRTATERGEATDETVALSRVPLDEFSPTPLQLGVKANVAGYIAESLEQLASRVDMFERAMRAELASSRSSRSSEQDQRVIEALRQKLDDAHALIAEQDHMLQAALIATGDDLATMRHHRRPSMDDGGASAHGKSRNKLEDGTTSEKENVHRNIGKPRVRSASLASAAGGSTAALRAFGARTRRTAPVEVAIVEQWADDLETEWQDVRRKQQNLNQERQLLQERGQVLDEDRLAFEMAKWDRFFGNKNVLEDPEDELVIDVDEPASPRTTALLRDIGIRSASPASS